MTKKHNQPQTEALEAESQNTEEPQTANETQELISQLQRLQAEFDNFRKRTSNEAKSAADRGQEKLLIEIFSIIDSLELAMKHKNHDCDLGKGLELIYSQLLTLLEQHGIERIAVDGQVNPHQHEVYITETNTDAKPGSIIEVLQAGYARNGTVLRTAKVKAARKELQ